MELKDKIAVLTKGIEYYKSIEKTMNKALILAEKTSEDIKIGAQKEAKRIEKEAATKASIMLADAKNELENLHQQTVALIQQYEKYKAQFKHLAKAQIELIESDAFNINIAGLDAFLNDPDALKPPKPSPRKEDNSAQEGEDEHEGNGNMHLSDLPEENEEFVFANYQLEGQEKFDFVDLNDGE